MVSLVLVLLYFTSRPGVLWYFIFALGSPDPGVSSFGNSSFVPGEGINRFLNIPSAFLRFHTLALMRRERYPFEYLVFLGRHSPDLPILSHVILIYLLGDTDMTRERSP